MRVPPKILRPFQLTAWGLVSIASLLGGAQAADALDTVKRLQREGQTAQALIEADRFLATDPRDARMRFLKSVILSDVGRTADAMALLEQLTRDYPTLAEPFNNLATLHAAAGRYDTARAALEEAVRLRPDYATAHENLGDVYAALAAREYGTAVQLDPGRAALTDKINRLRGAGAPVAESPGTGASATAPTPSTR
jgi:Flp pilus assembly protein TadD